MQQFRGRMQVTITTINTWKCEGDYFPRMKALARHLSVLDSGVILCQECFRTASADTLTYLSEALEMKAYRVDTRYKPRLFMDRWVDSSSGMGVLSRCPVVSESALDLPSSDLDGGRAAQCLLLEPLPGITLFLVNVHLSHVSGAGALRAAQLDTVLQAADASGARYRVIGGDFNAESGSEEMQALLARGRDTYVLSGGAEPRTSLVGAWQAGRAYCVDYLFVLPYPGTSDYPRCVDGKMVLRQEDEQTRSYPSDHFGVSTTLILD